MRDYIDRQAAIKLAIDLDYESRGILKESKCREIENRYNMIPTARENDDEYSVVEVATPHGRLIDADALADVFRGHIALYDSCPFSQLSFTDKARRDELQSSLAEVINAPTIIEAEEGAKE